MNDSAMPSPQEREAALFALGVEKLILQRRIFCQLSCEYAPAKFNQINQITGAWLIWG